MLDPLHDALAADLVLELSEDSDHPYHRTPGRRPEVEGLRQRHEGDTELRELAEG